MCRGLRSAPSPPGAQVSRPKGAFCQLDCSALVGLHPAAVFEVMCDTGNKRIFRNAEVPNPPSFPPTSVPASSPRAAQLYAGSELGERPVLLGTLAHPELCAPASLLAPLVRQGVKDRRVLEDSPEKKVVELEMLTSWRFLFLSGEFSVNLRLTQDRPNCKVRTGPTALPCPAHVPAPVRSPGRHRWSRRRF